MNANKVLWEKGDFTRIAASMRQGGKDLVDKLGITKQMKILDVGGGDGTTALPAAALCESVTVADIASNLVAAGNERAKQAGVSNCKFEEADATELKQYADDSFDMVLSIFGAMFAPRPMDVARQLVRVTRPGGKIVMGNWIPGDPTMVAQILKISSAYTPPPPEGFVSPMLWGVEQEVVARFTAAGITPGNISFSREIFTFELPVSPAEYVQLFRDYYGPTMNAFEAAEKNGQAAALQEELEALFTTQNRSGKPGEIIIDATYLLVQATKQA